VCLYTYVKLKTHKINS